MLANYMPKGLVGGSTLLKSLVGPDLRQYHHMLYVISDESTTYGGS